MQSELNARDIKYLEREDFTPADLKHIKKPYDRRIYRT